jgi:hypothetical protein
MPMEYDAVDPLEMHVKIAMLRADIEELRAERDTYKKLWYDQISLRTGHDIGGRKPEKPFWRWLVGRG